MFNHISGKTLPALIAAKKLYHKVYPVSIRPLNISAPDTALISTQLLLILAQLCEIGALQYAECRKRTIQAKSG